SADGNPGADCPDDLQFSGHVEQLYGRADYHRRQPAVAKSAAGAGAAARAVWRVAALAHLPRRVSDYHAAAGGGVLHLPAVLRGRRQLQRVEGLAMLAGLLACWRGLRHLERRGYIYIWGNLWWFVLSLPIVTAPAAWAGLMHLGYVAHYSPGVNLEAFWDGFRANLRRGFVLALLNAIVIGVNLVNLWGVQGQSGLAYDTLR